MKRRSFFSHSVVAIAGGATGAKLHLEFGEKATDKNISSPDPAGDFEIVEATIDGLQEQMAGGKYTSETITQLYLNRIEALDKNGPKLNAIIELNPDAIAIAKAMDEERKAGKVRGPMHGIPILIKDNIDTADKMMTTAGSLALVNCIAPKDAFIVKQLRDAGAVILGKTNLSEWANFRSTKSCSGWSSRGGQTKMPYYTDRNPCGSSSGSGVAVAANLCAVAVGTETDGSVTCPASINSLVGIKPTVGLLSRSGIIPISVTQDTAGPLARTVKDAVLLLAAMVGHDASDSKMEEKRGFNWADGYKIMGDGNWLNGKRIGVDKKKFENQFVNRLQQQAIDVLKNEGATIIEIEFIDEFSKLGEAEFEFLKFEFKDGLEKYLANSNSLYKTLEDIIAFNRYHEDEAMPTFKQEIMEDSEKKAGLKSQEYLDLLAKTHLGSKKMIDDLLQVHQLDAIAGLTMGPACAIDTLYGDRWGDVSITSPAAMAGYPHISVPAGSVFDLPVGLSFFGTAWSEWNLIYMAYSFEQATKHRKKPEFKQSFSI
jgi:amidase